VWRWRKRWFTIVFEYRAHRLIMVSVFSIHMELEMVFDCSVVVVAAARRTTMDLHIDKMELVVVVAVVDVYTEEHVRRHSNIVAVVDVYTEGTFVITL
jgi:hypothetical protein